MTLAPDLRELQLWEAAGFHPVADTPWYDALGQGMGATLQFANERSAYTLTDRGTYLALQDGLPNLVIMVGGATIGENSDPRLLNPYSVIPVNPDVHPHIESVLAQSFVRWITSVETQARIAEFGVEEYGQPLFYPDSVAWRAMRS